MIARGDPYPPTQGLVTDPVQRIMDLARSVAGIEFTDAKRQLVESRLAKRLRHLDLGMDAYADLAVRDAAEQEILFNALTTNHTAWLREPAHFDDLSRRVLPALAQEGRQQLRVWCAAASTGEEPYSIALTFARFAGENLPRWNAAVLCTDLSTKALAIARAGVYASERIAPLTPEDRQLALEPDDGPPTTRWRVRAPLRSFLHFARLNLMDPWPMKGPFDVIFCRNVMIYFSRETQERLVNRMAALLTPGGTLYVGHSESLSAIQHPLITRGPAIHVRP